MTTKSMKAAIDEGNLEKVKALFQKTGEDSVQDPALLHFSVINDQYDITQYFLEQGCDPNAENGAYKKIFPLQALQSVKVAQLLIEKHSANIKAASSDDQRTVLHSVLARDNVSVELIEYLLKQGALVNAQNAEGHNPLLHFMRYYRTGYRGPYSISENSENFEEIITLLLQHGSETRLVNKYGDSVDTLLEKRAEITEDAPTINRVKKLLESFREQAATSPGLLR